MKKIIIALALILTTSSSWAWELTTNNKGNNIWQHTYNDGATITYRPNKNNYKFTFADGRSYFGRTVAKVMSKARINRRAQGELPWEASTEPWVTPEIKEAWKQGYIGQNIDIKIMDDYIKDWGYRYTLHGRERVTIVPHGVRVENIASDIAPGSNITRGPKWEINYNNPELFDYDIINMSFGYSPKVLDEERIARVKTLPITDRALIVKSAGNSGSACTLNTVCTPENIELINGHGDQILIVGALDHTNRIANYSNRAGLLKDNYVVDNSNYTITTGGTSFSAPTVTGKAAIIKSKFNNLNGSQLANIIKTTADDLGAPGVDEVYGHGRVNLSRALSPVGQLN